MTPKELRNILLSAGIPVAYRQFEEGNAPALPWAVYLIALVKRLIRT